MLKWAQNIKFFLRCLSLMKLKSTPSWLFIFHHISPQPFSFFLDDTNENDDEKRERGKFMKNYSNFLQGIQLTLFHRHETNCWKLIKTCNMMMMLNQHILKIQFLFLIPFMSVCRFFVYECPLHKTVTFNFSLKYYCHYT